MEAGEGEEKKGKVVGGGAQTQTITDTEANNDNH